MTNDESPQGGTVPVTSQPETATPETAPKSKSRAPRRPKVAPAEAVAEAPVEAPLPIPDKPKRVVKPRKPVGKVVTPVAETVVEPVQAPTPPTPAKAPSRRRRGKPDSIDNVHELVVTAPTLDLGIESNKLQTPSVNAAETNAPTETTTPQKPEKKRPPRRQGNKRAQEIDEVSATVQELLSFHSLWNGTAIVVSFDQPEEKAVTPPSSPPPPLSRRRRGRVRQNPAEIPSTDTPADPFKVDMVSDIVPTTEETSETTFTPEPNSRPSRRPRPERAPRTSGPKPTAAGKVHAAPTKPVSPPPPLRQR